MVGPRCCWVNGRILMLHPASDRCFHDMVNQLTYGVTSANGGLLASEVLAFIIFHLWGFIILGTVTPTSRWFDDFFPSVHCYLDKPRLS